MTNSAERIAQLFASGTTWETERGARLADYLAGARPEPRDGATVYRFHDGSGIVEFAAGFWSTEAEALAEGWDGGVRTIIHKADNHLTPVHHAAEVVSTYGFRAYVPSRARRSFVVSCPNTTEEVSP